MSMKNLHPAEEICYVMKRAYERNMVSAAGGCLSIRDQDGIMWISPTSQDKGDLKPEMIARYNMDGELLTEYKGSMEWDNHLAIYKARPDVKAVFHTHSSGVLSTVFAREPLEYKYFANVAAVLGTVTQIPFHVPGCQELCDDIVAAVKEGHNILSLDSHGSYVLSGEGLFEAFCIQDMLEMSARSAALAPSIGNLLPQLKDEAVAAYQAAKEAEAYETEDFGTEPLAAWEQRKALCEYTRRGYQNQVIDCCQSSFSIRLGEDDFLITPDGKDLAELAPQDIVRVKNGKVEAGKKAPFRTGLHRAVYLEKSFIGSVLINASAYAAMYCITDAGFDCSIDPELTFCVKGVKKYSFGTQAEEIARGFEENCLAAVVENDCIVSAAVNAVKTLGIGECLEYASRAVSEMSVRNRKPVQIDEYR